MLRSGNPRHPLRRVRNQRRESRPLDGIWSRRWKHFHLSTKRTWRNAICGHCRSRFDHPTFINASMQATGKQQGRHVKHRSDALNNSFEPSFQTNQSMNAQNSNPNTDRYEPTTITQSFSEIHPVRSLASTGMAIVFCVSVLVLGMAFNSLDFALYGVMLSLAATGIVLSIGWAYRLQDWVRLSDAELGHLEIHRDVWAFLRQTTSSTTPARSAIYGLAHSVRPGREVNIDGTMEVLLVQLTRPTTSIRLMAQLLILLGIFGTALGAMRSLVELTAFATTSEIDGGPELFRQLLGVGGPIASMGVAYGSTVLGLIGSMILRSTAAALDASANAYANHLREVMQNYVAPDLWQEPIA